MPGEVPQVVRGGRVSNAARLSRNLKRVRQGSAGFVVQARCDGTVRPSEVPRHANRSSLRRERAAQPMARARAKRWQSRRSPRRKRAI